VQHKKEYMVFSSFVIVVVGIIHSFFSGMMLYHCVSIILHLKKNLLIFLKRRSGRKGGPGQKKWDFFKNSSRASDNFLFFFQ